MSPPSMCLFPRFSCLPSEWGGLRGLDHMHGQSVSLPLLPLAPPALHPPPFSPGRRRSRFRLHARSERGAPPTPLLTPPGPSRLLSRSLRKQENKPLVGPAQGRCHRATPAPRRPAPASAAPRGPAGASPVSPPPPASVACRFSRSTDCTMHQSRVGQLSCADSAQWFLMCCGSKLLIGTLSRIEIRFC